MVSVNHVGPELVHGSGDQPRRRDRNWKIAAVEMLNGWDANDVCVITASVFCLRGDDQRFVIAAAIFFIERHHTPRHTAQHRRKSIRQHQDSHDILALVSNNLDASRAPWGEIAPAQCRDRRELSAEKPDWLVTVPKIRPLMGRDYNVIFERFYTSRACRPCGARRVLELAQRIDSPAGHYAPCPNALISRRFS